METLYFETLPEDLIFELFLILKSDSQFSESCEYVKDIYKKYLKKLSIGALNNFDYIYPKDIFYFEMLYFEMPEAIKDNVLELASKFKNLFQYFTIETNVGINSIMYVILRSHLITLPKIYTYMDYNANILINIDVENTEKRKTNLEISSEFRELQITYDYNLISLKMKSRLNTSGIKYLYIYKICQHRGDNTVYIGKLKDNTYFYLAALPLNNPIPIKVGYYKYWKHLWDDLDTKTKREILRINGYVLPFRSVF